MSNQILLIMEIAALVVTITCWIICIVAKNNKSIGWKAAIIAMGALSVLTVMLSIFDFKHGNKVGFGFWIVCAVGGAICVKNGIEKLRGAKSVRTSIVPIWCEGDNLTQGLKGFGFPRQESESDWEYRQRVFPELYFKKGFTVAISILMGCSVTELRDTEKMSLQFIPREPENMNSHKRKQFTFQLKNFAQGFSEDPLKTRNK